MAEYTERIIGNAIVKIYRPALTEAERRKREDQLLIGLQQFGKAMEDARRAMT